MRVGLFHPSFTNLGGAEILCLAHAASLRAAGDDVTVVSFEIDPDVWAARAQGLDYSTVPRRHWRDGLHNFSITSKLRARGRRAASALAHFDLVVAHNPPCPAMLGVTDMPARRTWYCHEPPRGLYAREANPTLTARALTQGLVADDEATRAWRRVLADEDRARARRRNDVRREFDRRQILQLDHVVANSEFTRNNARRVYGRCGEQVVHPIVRFPTQALPRFGLRRQGLGVLVHSRLEVMKNIDTVIRGFAAFHAGHPSAHLHVVGEGGSRASLERLAREVLPASAFTFHGYLAEDDLRRVYAACDALALLPLDEPFGMVFPEAAAAGLLLIGPDHGGPLEILDGGRLGWSIDAFDPLALREALEELTRLDDAAADRRRAAADQACRSRYAEATIAPRLRRVLLNGDG